MSNARSAKQTGRGRPRTYRKELRVRDVDSVPHWVARWRPWSADGHRLRRSAVIAPISEMTEVAARAAMDAIILGEESQRRSARWISETTSVCFLPQRPLPKTAVSRFALGKIAEMAVASDLLSKGIEVFQAMDPTAGCDLLIVGQDGQPIRIEVKASTSVENGKVRCDVSRNVGKFDVLAVVLTSGEIAYRAHADIENSLYPLGRIDEKKFDGIDQQLTNEPTVHA